MLQLRKMNEANSRAKRNLPEGFWRFIIICFILYAFFIVGKVVYDNYQENKGLLVKEKEIEDLRNEIDELKYNIAYYRTNTYKEKVARAKLRYIMPGETAVAVPYDEGTKEQDKKADASPLIISRPNYVYWSMYFFGKR